MKSNPWLLGLGLLLFMSGCAQTYRFKVDALAAPVAGETRTFAIETPRGGEGGSQLRYREAADYVERALIARGWQEAEADAANLLVQLEASVSNPLTETEVRSEPVYFETWGRSRYIRTPVFNEDGKVVRYVGSYVWSPPRTYFAGYNDYARNYTVYEKTLTITAVTQEGEEAWTVTVATIDESSDLRSYIPLLAAAALPYVGETTDGAVMVRLKADDEKVQYLRGQLEGAG